MAGTLLEAGTMAYGHQEDSHRRAYSARAYLVPVVWIAVLVVSYLVLADWQSITATLTTMG